MTKKVPLASVRKLLKETKPKNQTEFSRVFPIRFIASGAFRKVYALTELDLVVKFPIEGDYFSFNLSHAKREINAFFRYKRIKRLRKYLPNIVYADLSSGVVVMEKYKRRQADWSGLENTKRVFKGRLADLGVYNVFMDKKGNPKVIDLGC